MKRAIIFLAMIPSTSVASDALSTAFNACMKSDKIDTCKIIKSSVDDVEKQVVRTLEEYGMKNSAIVMASFAKIAVDRRIRISTGSWSQMNINRSVIEINEERVYLTLEWGL